jgi:hypothetical protein
MNVAETNHIARLRELVNDADSQVRAASDAHDHGEDKALASAHRQLAGTIRSMRRTFDSLGKAGEAADQAASQQTVTSAGVSTAGGTSSPQPPRAAAPVRTTPGLLTNDPKTWLDRAREGGSRR